MFKVEYFWKGKPLPDQRVTQDYAAQLVACGNTIVAHPWMDPAQRDADPGALTAVITGCTEQSPQAKVELLRPWEPVSLTVALAAAELVEAAATVALQGTRRGRFQRAALVAVPA